MTDDITSLPGRGDARPMTREMHEALARNTRIWINFPTPSLSHDPGPPTQIEHGPEAARRGGAVFHSIFFLGCVAITVIAVVCARRYGFTEPGTPAYWDVVGATVVTFYVMLIWMLWGVLLRHDHRRKRSARAREENR